MKLRPFEIILVVVFFGLAVLALLILSMYQARNGDDGPQIGVVKIWGTLESAAVNSVLDQLMAADDGYSDVTYRQLDESQFANSVTNALADGSGPDILLISNEQLVEMRRRITPISYESFPIRDIRSLYLDGAEIFALSDGLYAYPIAVDPLMLYWNRDILTNQGFLEAPQTWESMVSNYVPAITVRDFDRTIRLSAVAMGEYENIRNSFAALSTLLLQSGSRFVEENGGIYDIRINQTNSGGQPLVATTDFYTRFSRPNNTLYSWNRSFVSDRDRFLSEDLSMYFGFGSEGRELEKLNPNLNFDIAEMPQGASATIRRTYGKFYGVSLVRNSRNQAGAATVMSVLASTDTAKQIATNSNLVPVTRSVVSAGSNDTYGRLTYRSAAISYGWLNPPRQRVDAILTSTLRDITEGRLDATQATVDAVGRLQFEYNQ